MQTLDGTSTQPTPDVEIVAVAPLTHEIPAAQPAAVAFPASGLYQSAPGLTGEELRLDVDGRYPQMVGSGTIRSSLTARVHWVANLTVNGPNSWKGPIWYKNGATSTFPYTSVKIDLSPGAVPSQQRATATFSAGRFANR